MMTRIEVDRIREDYPPGSHVKLIEQKQGRYYRIKMVIAVIILIKSI